MTDEQGRSYEDYCAFLLLDPIVNAITTENTIVTSGIIPNSGIGSSYMNTTYLYV
jgi:hypothetical protein